MSIISKITFTAIASVMALGMSAKDGSGLKVYINPGHGGHDSDDRNVAVWPYAQGDSMGYWESNSNLRKGLYLRDMLQAKGYQVTMSRVWNRSEDDLGLSTIVRLSNESGSNIFYSIHSNATGTSSRCNFPLMLYRGYDNEPQVGDSQNLCKVLDEQLLDNQATVWTSTNPNIRGDWSFYTSWGTSGLGALRGQQRTSMLSEGSFHDYIPETYRLLNNDFCWLEAWHFRKATDNYLGVDGEPDGVVCGRVNDNRVPRTGDFIMFKEDKFATIQGAKVELVDAAGTVVDTYTTDPVLPNGFYLFKHVAPGTYTVRASVSTHRDASQEVEVTANNVSYANLQMAKIRNTAPEVLSYSPNWKEGDEAVACNSPIVINFNWDMDMPSAEAAFSINPPIAGTFSWEDQNYRMVFTPDGPYATGTQYTVTLAASAQHPEGMHMANDFSFSFVTSDRNYMQVLASFPKDGDRVHYQKAYIEFRFDKRPNTTPILKQVTCKDSKGNAVAFNNRGMTQSKNTSTYGFFRIPFMKDLTIGETYNVEVSADFADKEGLTLEHAYDVHFTAVNAADDADASARVVDDMDNAGAYSYDADRSQGVTSASVAASTADKLFGTGAVKYTYALEGEEDGEVVWSREPLHTEGTAIAPEELISVQVNGDLSGNQLYLELTSPTLVNYVKVTDLDFLGWKFIQVPALIDATAQLTGIKLTQTKSQASHSGTFMLDQMTSEAVAGVNDILAEGNGNEVTVSYVPGSDYVVANAPSFITGIELLDLKGAVVAANAGNVINVSETPANVYLVRVYTASSTTIHKIAVKH